MLRFNWCANKSLASLCISIHPMLRFNQVHVQKFKSDLEFQYILCYGSTLLFLIIRVTISGFQYILCYGSTNVIKEIREKLEDFNTSYVTVQRNRYFLIFSSVSNFNTSYVTVQQGGCEVYYLIELNFNTSYVTVQRVCFLSWSFVTYISIHPMLRFNNYKMLVLFGRQRFQYILCYGST